MEKWFLFQRVNGHGRDEPMRASVERSSFIFPRATMPVFARKDHAFLAQVRHASHPPSSA